MTQLEIMGAWLQRFPGWDGTLHMDTTGPLPGAGLFPGGLEEVSRQENLLGQVTVHNRLHFTLHRLVPGPGDRQADWLLALQQWVQQQSAQGLAPTFGDRPQSERIRAERGKLSAAPQPGTVRYTVHLTVDYVKIIDNG